jgi:hypothetical protein
LRTGAIMEPAITVVVAEAKIVQSEALPYLIIAYHYTTAIEMSYELNHVASIIRQTKWNIILKGLFSPNQRPHPQAQVP